MTTLPIRLTLLFACVAAVGYASFLTWSSGQHIRLTDNPSRQFDAAARATSSGVAELRAAQEAYVAVGQGEDFWFARVSAIGKDLNGKLSTLKSLATGPETLTAVDEATGALQDFNQMDKRARDYARSRQLTLASDLIFTDGFDLTKKAGEAVERAVTAELTARDAQIAGLRRSEARALAGAGGVATPGLLRLLPTGRKRQEPETATASIAPPRPTVSAETLADLQDFGIVAPPPAPVTTGRGGRDLGGMGAVCADP